LTIMLSDEFIRLRAPEPYDLDRLYIWENDTELWPCGSASAPLSRQQIKEYIDSYDADIFAARQLRFVIELRSSGEMIGTVDLTDFDPRDRHARVGVFVAPPHRCCGVAGRAVSMVMDYARSVAGMHMLLALVAVDNAPSRALFSAAGFSTCGRVRSYLRCGRSYSDIIVYQALL